MELTDRLKQRDPEALAELYDRYSRMVFTVIHRQIDDRAIVEDLVQETFLRIWTGIDAFDPGRPLGPWIIAVARNRAIDYLRSLECRIAQTSTEFDPTLHPAPHQAVVEPEAEHNLLHQERLATVRRALASLRPVHRTAVELAFGEGLSHAEIAVRLRLPLGTVKTWLRSAVQILRTQLA